MISIIYQSTDDTGYKYNLEFYVTSYYDSLLEHTSDISHPALHTLLIHAIPTMEVIIMSSKLSSKPNVSSSHPPTSSTSEQTQLFNSTTSSPAIDHATSDSNSHHPRSSRPRWIIRRLLTTLLAILIVVGAASPFVAVQYQKQVFAERVHTYLIQQKHYKPEQIASIQGIWGIMLPSFYVEVIFKDEPNRVYTYFAHAEIMQQSHRLLHATDPDQSNDSGAKHAEEPI